MPREIVDFRVGDVVQLRKPHPCGGYVWSVVRLGADIGLKCATCGRRILLERAVLERRLKTFLERGTIPNIPVEGDDQEPSRAGPP